MGCKHGCVFILEVQNNALFKSDSVHHHTSVDNREHGPGAASGVPGGGKQVKGRLLGPGLPAREEDTAGCLQRRGPGPCRPRCARGVPSARLLSSPEARTQSTWDQTRSDGCETPWCPLSPEKVSWRTSMPGSLLSACAASSSGAFEEQKHQTCFSHFQKPTLSGVSFVRYK